MHKLKKRQLGVSLAEAMISMTILIFIFLATTNVLAKIHTNNVLSSRLFILDTALNNRYQYYLATQIFDNTTFTPSGCNNNNCRVTFTVNPHTPSAVQATIIAQDSGQNISRNIIINTVDGTVNTGVMAI